MLSPVRILCSIFIICSPLKTLPLGPQGPRPKIILSRYKPIAYINPIAYTIFLTRWMNENGIPKDITNHILAYSMQLKNENFITNFPHLNEWYDFCIPVQYQYVLTSEQLNTLGNVFVNQPRQHRFTSLERRFSQEIIGNMYRLQSEKDYKLFLQLPIEVRTCLTKLPKPAFTGRSYDNIDGIKKILVLSSCQTDFLEKLILSKEKKQLTSTTCIIY
jgi:hypothetical protein